MFSSLLRPSRRERPRKRVDRLVSPSTDRNFSSFRRSFLQSRTRRLSSQTLEEDENTEGHDEDEQEDYDDDEEEGEDDQDDQDEDEEQGEDEEADANTPLLPIFSSAHLDQIYVYTLTHTIRDLVVGRCETVLSWEQLRSPQVTAFLMKPIQQAILADHFNAATEYALMTNCLQFKKEATMYPGNSGTSNTRAMLCELLAIRLLREYSTRAMIDALSYDFDPLKGQYESNEANAHGVVQAPHTPRKAPVRVARISCFEVALRAQAKRFIAHPLVVQQLEAIWAGTIVFHSAADSMHRKQIVQTRQLQYGTTDHGNLPNYDTPLRRTVTIYNPRDASLFKLSRLRVPRYRNILSTLSFAILLGLFLAVLTERSLEITPLEIVFWFWSAGYMLDEIVGFTDQGFALYIASFWNTFDLGIVMILFAHLCLRIYGIVSPLARKHSTADMAYDILAADAVLLFPRLFSVLDHYKYFSQLLIAFRMMAQDLVAVLILIMISCSGFFVTFTLGFKISNDDYQSPSSVAYALLQMVMGFTPAAWDRWNGYNILGKGILTLFLFITHFLVVVILITVLTNSFLAVVNNANEEHQFVFAVNTISSVKSDALFSYVAPTNVVQWVLTPLRYFVPFRQYVKINRTIIKATHFPILFSIYLYESTILASAVRDRIDVVENRARPKRPYAPRLPRLTRAPSIATFKQDRALDEVFRNAPEGALGQNQPEVKSVVVNNWMNTMADHVVSPPLEEDRKMVDKLERHRVSRRFSSRQRLVSRRTMSIASDPEDLRSRNDFMSPSRPLRSADVTPSQAEGPAHHTDADGDDEMQTDYDDIEKTSIDPRSQAPDGQADLTNRGPQTPDYFGRVLPQLTMTPPSLPATVANLKDNAAQSSGQQSPTRASARKHTRLHSRNFSSATQIYKPIETSSDHSSDGQEVIVSDKRTAKTSSKGQSTVVPSGAASPVNKSGSGGEGKRSPPKPKLLPPHLRPIMPNQSNAAFRSTPNISAVVGSRTGNRQEKRRPSLEMDLVSDIGDNKAIGGGYVGAIPAGFATQMFQASASHRHQQQQKEEQERFSRLIMARMNSLEEGMREVIHEMRDAMKYDGGRSRDRSPERPLPKPLPRERRAKEKDSPTSASSIGKHRGGAVAEALEGANEAGRTATKDFSQASVADSSEAKTA